MTDGLKSKQRETIIKTLSANPKVERIVLFGSRAMGTYTPTSDIDIALFGDELTLSDQAALSEALAELTIPQRVNILIYHRIENQALREHIRKHGVEWFARACPHADRRSLGMAGEWRECTIGDVADIVGGSTPSTSDPSNFDGSIPWLTPKDLAGQHDRYVTRGKRNLSEKGLESCSARLLPPGTVLLTTRAPIGYVAIAKTYIATNQGFRSLVLKPGVDSEYIYYWLKVNVEELERHASGSTFRELTGSALAQIRIRIPPLPEQRAIAHILGTLDDKIELNRKQNATLEAMARALFRAWFVDFEPVRAKMEGRWRRGQSLPGLPAHLYDLFPDRLVESELGEIPEGWEVKMLSDICSTQYGYTASALEEPLGPKLLRVTDINKRNWIEWDTVPYCSIGPEEKDKYKLVIGDIVVARMADPGKSAIVEEDVDAVFASYLVRLQTESLTHAYYIYGFLKSDAYREYSEAATSGSVQANMNAKVIVGVKLVVPPLAAMGAYLNAVRPLRGQLVANLRESRTLAALRDTLLPKLISGEIRVKDAERFLKERGL